MKRRILFKAAALAVLFNWLPRRARSAARALGEEHRGLLAAVGDVALPTSLGVDGRKKAVEAFAIWLDDYKAGRPMSYGYGDPLKYGVVPPSPVLRYPAHFQRLQELSRAKGSDFASLSSADGKTVLEAALREANVTELPDRPDGGHVASDLLSHFYSGSDGNDFLFNASIRVSACRGLDTSGERPVFNP